VQDVARKYERSLSAIEEGESRWNRLCEFNIVEQVINVCETTIVQDAWRRGQRVDVHGWIYDLRDGLMRDLKICISNEADMIALEYRMETENEKGDESKN